MTDEGIESEEVVIVEAEAVVGVVGVGRRRASGGGCPGGGRGVGCDGEGEDAGGVGMGEGEDGVGVQQVGVVGGDEDDGTVEAIAAIGHGLVGGDAGGEVEEELCFAGAAGAIEQGDGATGDVAVPEPGGVEDAATGKVGDLGEGRGG